MFLHLVAFPFEMVDEHPQSSFSVNAGKFRDMMVARGHEVHVYEGDAERPDDAELWNPESAMWRGYNEVLVRELRHKPGVICLITGDPHRELLEGLPGRTVVEISPGYVGVLSGSHRVFESYAWLHWIAGRDHDLRAHPTDIVIPHFYDPAEFPIGTDGGYLLFVGRAQEDKGMYLALEAAHRAGLPLVTIGHGTWPLGVDARGFVSPEERNDLMANARALLCPTLYIEPGGHVASEALMCGTPVVTTAWGCFAEFIEEGVNGFLCHDVDEMVHGIAQARRLNRGRIQKKAVARFSYDAIAPQFERYFDRLMEGD